MGMGRGPGSCWNPASAQSESPQVNYQCNVVGGEITAAVPPTPLLKQFGAINDATGSFVGSMDVTCVNSSHELADDSGVLRTVASLSGDWLLERGGGFSNSCLNDHPELLLTGTFDLAGEVSTVALAPVVRRVERQWNSAPGTPRARTVS